MANPITAVRDYIKHSIAELKKVTWPNRELTLRFSALVIVVSVAFAGFFAALDYGLQQAVDAVFIPRAAAPQPVDLDVQPALLDAEGNPVNADLEDLGTQVITDEPTPEASDDDGANADASAEGDFTLPSLE